MEYRMVAKVIVVSSDNKILLLKRSKTDVRRPLQWDIPGGHTDENEFAEEAAIRETKEETGIEIPIHGLRLAYAISDNVENNLNVTWLFYIAQVDGLPEVNISGEHAGYAWEELDKVIEKVDYERQKKAFQYVRDNRLIS